MSSTSLLGDSVGAVAQLLQADAVMLAAWDSGVGRCSPLYARGYTDASVAALAGDYPAVYTVPMLTGIYGGSDPLVYTIGDEPPSPLPFLQSRIYRDALGLQGFHDGMTLQVRNEDQHIGYAHFSSLEPERFRGSLQDRARSLNNILSELIGLGDAAEDGWFDVDGAGLVTPGPRSSVAWRADAKLLAVVLAFLRWTSAPSASFLWADGRAFVRVSLERREVDRSVRVRAMSVDLPFALTAAELRVLTGMVIYPSNEAIAHAFGVSVRTVHTHVANLLRKMECSNRTQAVVLAMRERLLLPDSEAVVALSGWALI